MLAGELNPVNALDPSTIAGSISAIRSDPVIMDMYPEGQYLVTQAYLGLLCGLFPPLDKGLVERIARLTPLVGHGVHPCYQ